MKPGRCYIGTSGWSYPHWAKGLFYPEGLKPGLWLPFLARYFNTVEVNVSFYRLPKPEMISRWREVTPGRFRFAVKLWRRITHEKRLRNCARELQEFFGVAGEFGTKRGPVLVQLPPSLKVDAELLDGFLADLRRITGKQRWRVAVEFRHLSWLCAPVYDLLNRHKAALCLADMPNCAITEPNDAPFVYLRRHGPGGKYRGLYGEKHIQTDAERIHTWLKDGRDVFVYYNNDIGGYAVANAFQLADAVGMP